MCEKVQQQPEARKITGMEAKREYCRANAREKRDEAGIAKKSGKRDVDARDLSGRVRASISQSHLLFFSTLLSDILLLFTWHISYDVLKTKTSSNDGEEERIYFACRQKCEIKLIPMHLLKSMFYSIVFYLKISPSNAVNSSSFICMTTFQRGNK